MERAEKRFEPKGRVRKYLAEAEVDESRIEKDARAPTAPSRSRGLHRDTLTSQNSRVRKEESELFIEGIAPQSISEASSPHSLFSKLCTEGHADKPKRPGTSHGSRKPLKLGVECEEDDSEGIISSPVTRRRSPKD